MLSHYEIISSDKFEGRKIGSNGGNKAKEYLKRQLEGIEIKPFNKSYIHSFGFNNKVGNNVVGVILGKKYPDKYIVLTAHFDHLGKKHSRIYNGADDNASGTAALLSIAKKIQEVTPNYSVITLFTDGEESNLQGAKAFIKQNPSLIKKIVLNINMDMLSGSKHSKSLHYISKDLRSLLSPIEATKLESLGNYRNLPLRRGFRNKAGGSINKRTNWIMASDHGVFYKNKIPFLYFGVGTHRNYHTEFDTFENSNTRLLVNSANVIYHHFVFLDKTIKQDK